MPDTTSLNTGKNLGHYPTRFIDIKHMVRILWFSEKKLFILNQYLSRVTLSGASHS